MHFNDPNFLVLFGNVLGIIGALLLGIDALGAPDFLAAIKVEKENGFQMTNVGFRALINKIFIYLFISFIGFITLLVTLHGNFVFSMIVAPFVYFSWKLVVYFAERLSRLVKSLGPGNYVKNRQGYQFALSYLVQLIHLLIWLLPFVIVSLFSIVIRFGLDLPLTYISEKAMVPIVKRVYELSARVVAEEEKWKLKSTALIGSTFVLFGFFYQFIGTLLLIKW